MKDVLILRDQLRKERQAVEADKKAIERLTSSVEDLAFQVVCDSWRDRQQWRNIDMLMKTRISTSQCAKRIQLVDKVVFKKYQLPEQSQRPNSYQPPASGLGASAGENSDHPTLPLSEFFTLLVHNPEILTRVLTYADSCKLDSGPVVEIVLSSVYGNFTIPEDAACVLQLLDRLLSTQLPACRQPRLFFRGVACAFTRMLSLFCEGLFTAKTYLAESLHDCVKQILIDDRNLFEFEPAKLCSRLGEEERAELFDENMLPLPTSKSVKRDLDVAGSKVSSFCMEILSRLMEYLPHMPIGLRWLTARLKMHLQQFKVVKTKDEIYPLLADIIFGCFISPALAMPEAAIVAVDTTISETARYNLTQVARILQGAPGAALALKRDQEMPSYLRDVYAKVDLDMFKTFLDMLTAGIDVEAPPPVPSMPGLRRSNAFVTKQELSILLSFFEKARLPLTSRGLPSELIPLLDLLMVHPHTNPDIDKKVRKSREDQRSPKLGVVEERRGRSQSTIAMKSSSRDSGNPPSSSSIMRRQSQQQRPSVTKTPPSPHTRRLKRLKSEHLRPPSEVQVIPLQATKPCGHVDLLPVDEVLRRAAMAKKIVFQPKPPKVSSVGEATSQELTSDVLPSPRHQSVVTIEAASDHADPALNQSKLDAASADTASAGGVSTGGGIADVTSHTRPPASSSMLKSSVSSVRTPSCGSDPSPVDEVDAAPLPTTTHRSSTGATGETDDITPTASASHGDGTVETGKSKDSWPGAEKNDLVDHKRLSSLSLPSISAAFPSPSKNSPLATNVDELRRNSSLFDVGSVSAHPLLSSTPPDKRLSAASSSDLALDLAPLGLADAKDMHCSDSSLSTGAASDTAMDELGMAKTDDAKTEDPAQGSTSKPSGQAVFMPPGKALAKSLPKTISASTAQAQVASGTASSPPGKKLTISDSFRDYCVISSPEEVGLRQLTRSSEEVATASVWQRMAESRWSLSAMVRRGLVDSESGVGRLATKTWENISSAASLSGTLLRRMSINASSEMLEARERENKDNLEAWLHAAHVDKFATVTSPGAWEKLPLFNLLRWRLRGLLSEPSESGLADSLANCGAAQHTDRVPRVNPTTSPPRTSPLARGSLEKMSSFAGHSYAMFDTVPEYANPQVTQLFRCISQHLNTSRYMNNQGSCTVLHDTINLLKQLPERGILYLLEVLDRDYCQRAYYHVYLHGVRQNLLYMENFLLATLHHIDRHQHCSLQFFMATCVRLFLEPLADRLDQFVVKFEQVANPSDRALVMENFLADVYSRMDEDPTWSASQEHMYTAAQLSVERACFSRIYNLAFRPGDGNDAKSDQELSDRIDRLARIITVRHRALQIPEKYCRQAPWPAAVEALSHINLYKTPYDKLSVVHSCCQSIMQSLAVPCLPKDVDPASFAFLRPSGGIELEAPGADDFFPVLVYVILSTNPPGLVSTCNFVDTFQGNRLFGEVSYCWTQFCTALEFIKMIEL